MTHSETQALAALATHGLEHRLALPSGQPAQLKLTPLPPSQAPASHHSQRLRMEWAGGQMALDLAPATLDAWLQHLLGLASLVALPADFRQAALEHLVQTLTHKLEGAGRGQAQLLEVVQLSGPEGARPPDAPHALHLELTPEGGPPLSGVLHLDSLALMLVGSLAQAAPAQESLPMDALPVVLRLCVGHTALPQRQLAALKVGGLVFLAQSHVQGDVQGGQAVLLSTALGPRRLWTAPARVQDGQLILTADPLTMNTHTEPLIDSGDAPLSWDEMPVHLSFDVGHKVMSLAQLRQLGQGQALSLDRPIESAVNIRANGALIGQGQLVDIDGQLGVLIGQLRAPSPSNEAD